MESKALVVSPVFPVAERTLLIGQAPGADGDARPIAGAMGLRLAEWAGISEVERSWIEHEDETIGLYFGRANVLNHYPGPSPSGKGHAFPRDEARAGAEQLVPHFARYDRVLFCGRAVAAAFSRPLIDRGLILTSAQLLKLHKFEWTPRIGELPRLAWMPHPSPVVIHWNDPANVMEAKRFLRHLVQLAVT